MSRAKQRRLSANRIIVELVEEGMEAQKRQQKEFFALAERYRAATEPKDVRRLGDELGQMVFGDWCPTSKPGRISPPRSNDPAPA